MVGSRTRIDLERDGTSQGDRIQPALDPRFVQVEDRQARDWLRFARDYARELRFIDERGEATGDWSAFLEPPASGSGSSGDAGALLHLQHLAELVENPSAAALDGARIKPHLALFLAFLRLLRHPRDLINGFSQAHLLFYYEQVLRLVRKPAGEDQVHLLARLASGVERALLPAGTPVRTGKGGAGAPRFQTDRDLTLSRAQLTQRRSVFVDRERLGLRQIWQRRLGTAAAAFRELLQLALGRPNPGDALPQYRNVELDDAALRGLKQLLDFAPNSLFLELPDVHALLLLKRQRDGAAAQWAAINGVLERAGQTRRHDPSWRLAPADPRAFADNLAKALGGPPDFHLLAGIAGIEELYAQRLRQDVQQFVGEHLFLERADFELMMQLVISIENEWREINRLLEQAGRRKRLSPSFRLDVSMPTAFDHNLEQAVGSLDWAGLSRAVAPLPALASLDEYGATLDAIDPAFHMTPLELAFTLGVAARAGALSTPAANPPPGAEEWERVFDILDTAHQELLFADRRQALESAFQKARGAVATGGEAAGWAAVLRQVLGIAAGEPAPELAQVQRWVPIAGDFAFLSSIRDRLDQSPISGDEWARAFHILELAWRGREQLPPPVAQREVWRNLYTAADATAVVAPAGSAGGLARWKTFGQKPSPAPIPGPPGPIGWAVSSPLLWLAGGERRLTLTLGFLREGFDDAKLAALLLPPADPGAAAGDRGGPFWLELSTAKGWLVVAPTLQFASYPLQGPGQPPKAIQFELTLPESAAALAPPSADPALAFVSWPMLRLTLRPLPSSAAAAGTIAYMALRDLKLSAVHLHVDVRQLTPAALENAESALDPKKPFEPFGRSPAVGSRFLIGDPELALKRLESVTFAVQWHGPPQDLGAFYAAYSLPTTRFSVDISLVDDRVEHPIDTLPLFEEPDATQPHTLPLSGVAEKLEQRHAYRYSPRAELPARGSVSSWPRYFQWRLAAPDFQHQAYPGLVTRKALELVADIAKGQDAQGHPPQAVNYHVNPPYTPKIQRLRLDYTASLEVAVPSSGASSSADQLFHVHPFGVSPIVVGMDGVSSFLPVYEQQGELYLGFDELHPPLNLSLLFQLAEGTGNPDRAAPALTWSVLSGNVWIPLANGQVLSDTTRGLIQSGIVELLLPEVEPSTLLPPGPYWLRASVADGVDGVCDTIGVHPHAVSATSVSPSATGQPLPPRSITQLEQRVPAIAGLEQPYPSRGARAVESQSEFYIRASERLRHKQRALTIWDYEHLVLEAFPELYKVKCLPGNGVTAPLGSVSVVVIPRSSSGLTDPFEPKAAADRLRAIDQFLRALCPGDVKLTVQNAHFVPVQIRVGVRWAAGADPGLCAQRLNDELRRFLSPWAYDAAADITIGRKIYANSIIDFIDRRDYVDYVANIELFSSEDGGATFRFAPAPAAGEGYAVTTPRPDGVLVSAQHHHIDVISDLGYEQKDFRGINYMRIELDFIVA